jgi:hypothetical protein
VIIDKCQKYDTIYNTKGDITLERYNLSKIITNVEKDLMCQHKDFMKTVDDGKIYIEEDFDEWNKEHTLTSPIHRVIFKHVKSQSGIEGYAIKDTNIPTSLMIPDELVPSIPI